MVQKPALVPSSCMDTPMVDPLDRAILSSLVPKIHSACLDKRLRTNQAHGL